ncbi:MAG: DUF2183 domain-containing protein [Planctomycetes bacterium]|nr:DUF2183 domain-containing protein [Planctomycetota bacterium]
MSDDSFSRIRSDESVIVFPTTARLVTERTEDGEARFWEVPVHGWIFEWEDDSLWRRGALSMLRRVLELDDEPADGDPRAASEAAIFRRRARAFLVDNERGKRLRVRIDGRDYPLSASDAGGHFEGIAKVPAAAKGPERAPDWIDVRVLGRGEEGPSFPGRIQRVGAQGWVVVSDIDDTIKRTDVHSKRALLRSSFLLEFEAIPGMAAVYRGFAHDGASFEYLSSSPWQLYPELSAFFDATGLPPGGWHLQRFRAKDRTFWSLFSSPEARKSAVLEALLARSPQQRFVWIGDSAEQDPEIYGAIARAHHDRDIHIAIRRVTEDTADGPRWSAAFEGIDRSRWLLFDDPAELAKFVARTETRD